MCEAIAFSALDMHSPPDFFSEPAASQNGDQCGIDDDGTGQDNARPGQCHMDLVVVPGQQFDADSIKANLCYKNNSLRKNGASWMSHADRKEEDGQCAKDDQWQCNGGIPAITRMQPGNDAKIHGNAQTVQKQRDPKDRFDRKEHRQAENPQDDTDTNDIKGPVGKGNK